MALRSSTSALIKVGRYYQVYAAFASEAWINTSSGAVSAGRVFKDPSSIASLFDMDHSYLDVIEGLKNTAGANDHTGRLPLLTRFGYEPLYTQKEIDRLRPD